ncbi:MAG: amidohydrolase family protein [Herbinix sp.]|nr:amidohydrolase family protein [Herbinix sp.]
MVIDMHVHPGFYEAISEDQKETEFRKKAMGWDLMSKFPVELTRTQMEFAGVDKLVLLPLDLTTQMKGWVVTNEEVRQMMDIAPDLFYGFASVDPYREDALEVLDYAFKELKLMGLKLNPSKQAFYPSDPMMDKIYKKCIEYNKPIMFHAGMSWEPDCLMKYSKPLNFEEVAVKYPELRFCLAHFGWPWIYDTTALVLKYPNVYTDTSMLYMDSPEIFLNEVLKKQLGELWIDHNIHNKVMFGSNNPRFRTARIKRGLESIDFRPATKEKILGGNALKFLGLGE